MNKLLVVSLNSGLPLFSRSFAQNAFSESNIDDLQLSSLLFALNKISSSFDERNQHLKDDLKQFEQGSDLVTTISSELGDETILLAILSVKYLIDSSFSKLICLEFSKACKNLTKMTDTKKNPFHQILEEVYKSILLGQLEIAKSITTKYEILFSFPNLDDKFPATNHSKPMQLHKPNSNLPPPSNTTTSPHAIRDNQANNATNDGMREKSHGKEQQSHDPSGHSEPDDDSIFAFCGCFRTNRIAHDIISDHPNSTSPSLVESKLASDTTSCAADETVPLDMHNTSSSVSHPRSAAGNHNNSTQLREHHTIIPHASKQVSFAQLMELYDQLQIMKGYNWKEVITSPHFMHVIRNDQSKQLNLLVLSNNNVDDDGQQQQGMTTKTIDSTSTQELKVISLEDDLPMVHNSSSSAMSQAFPVMTSSPSPVMRTAAARRTNNNNNNTSSAATATEVIGGYSIYRHPQANILLQPAVVEDFTISLKLRPTLYHLATWIKFGIAENLL